MLRREAREVKKRARSGWTPRAARWRKAASIAGCYDWLLHYVARVGVEGGRMLGNDIESMDGWMGAALDEARAAAATGEVPVGAVVVRGSEILGRGHNRREERGDPVAHAELEAIARARRFVEGWRFEGCTMYVTLEPCAMCAGALVNARFEKLVFATADPKAGFCGSLGDLVRDPRLNHQLEVVAGVRRAESSRLLKSFFAGLR